jgi:hypothetical protein
LSAAAFALSRADSPRAKICASRILPAFASQVTAFMLVAARAGKKTPNVVDRKLVPRYPK